MAIPLTDEQERIVRHRGSPLRVVAGPGTGKTSCLVGRILDLMRSDRVDPRRILAVTFTRSAAREMRERLEGEGIAPDRMPDVRTLHSRAVAVLRRHGVRVGVDPRIRPLSELEVRVVLQDVAADLSAAGIRLPFRGSGSIGDYLRAYRAELSGAGVPSWIVTNHARQKTHEKFVQSYERLQRFYEAVDWVRVIPLTLQLFDSHPDVLESEQAGIEHLLVDEYQDLNRRDQQLVGCLARDPAGICIVGDEDQSIYETQRFAYPLGLVEFGRQFGGAATLPLTYCHRCPREIVEKANALIANNTVRIPGKAPLQTAVAENGVVATVYQRSKKAEIEWLANKVAELHKRGARYRDLMVLFSEGAIAEDYVDALKKASIPVEVQLRVTGPFDSACFVKLIAMLYFLSDQVDNLAVRQCLGDWQDIGPKTIKELRRIAEEGGVCLWDAVRTVGANPDRYRTILKRRSVETFYRAMVEFLGIREFDKIVPAILQRIPECADDTGVKIFGDWLSRQRGKEAVIGLGEVLRDFEQEREAGAFETTEEERPDKVRVMTMHSAKGLQAPVVIIPALEDDLMPGDVLNLEERRRLFYVSVTRSQKILLLSWASQRTGKEIHRRGGRMLGKQRSRFLVEMGE